MRAPFRFSALSLAAGFAILLLAGGGCGSSASVQSWQRAVERYVSERGGDPAVLRDVTLAGSRRGFGQIGADDPSKSVDVNAVLLGHKVVRDQPWFVYLVGVVQNQKVNEIRLAALSYASGKPTWRLSEKDANALHAYQNYNAGLWKQQHPGTKDKPPGNYTTFPREEDRFELVTPDGRVEARHLGSGAAWEVNLAGKKER